MRNVDYQLNKNQIGNMKDSIKLKGTYHFVHKDINGNIKDEWSVDNLITNAGFAQLALLTGDATAIPFTYLALGTSNTAAAASQTALQGEISATGLARVSATVSRVTTTVTNDTLQLYKVFTNSSAGTVIVEEVGIFNDATTGTMLSRALTSTKTVLVGETITITYKVKFS